MKSVLEYLPPALPPAAFLFEDGTLSGVRTEKNKTSIRLVSAFSEAAFDLTAEEWPGREEIAPFVERALHALGTPDRAAVLLPDPLFRMQALDLESFPKNQEEREKILGWQVKRNLGHPSQDLRIRHFPLDKEGDFTRLWVAAAPRELLSDIEAVFAGKGCHVGFIASPTMAINSMLAKKGIMGRDGLELLLNLTNKSVTFLFVQDGRPVFFRTKELRGGEYTVERVSQEVRLTLAFQKERLGSESLKRVCYRLAGEGVSFPAEEFEEGAIAENLEDACGHKPVAGISTSAVLPLIASLEGD